MYTSLLYGLQRIVYIALLLVRGCIGLSCGGSGLRLAGGCWPFHSLSKQGSNPQLMGWEGSNPTEQQLKQYQGLMA